MKPLFEYLDYRDYMHDHYRDFKERHSFFSYRYIEMKTGLDASFYVKVINKQKHIAEKAIPVLASFFGLNKRETDYFTSLVHFNKAKQKVQADYYFRKLRQYRVPDIAQLEEKKYHYFQNWYAIVIREMMATFAFKGDAVALCKRIIPEITESQAREALELLTDLKLIEKDEDGYYRATDRFLTTAAELRSAAVRQFQRQMVQLAGEAIDRIAPEERDISSLTLSTSRACLEAIRDKLDQTRKEIMQLVAEDSSAEEVYQLNFQVFPVTRNARGVTGTARRSR